MCSAAPARACEANQEEGLIQQVQNNTIPFFHKHDIDALCYPLHYGLGAEDASGSVERGQGRLASRDLSYYLSYSFLIILRFLLVSLVF